MPCRSYPVSSPLSLLRWFWSHTLSAATVGTCPMMLSLRVPLWCPSAFCIARTTRRLYQSNKNDDDERERSQVAGRALAHVHRGSQVRQPREEQICGCRATEVALHLQRIRRVCPGLGYRRAHRTECSPFAKAAAMVPRTEADGVILAWFGTMYTSRESRSCFNIRGMLHRPRPCLQRTQSS